MKGPSDTYLHRYSWVNTVVHPALQGKPSAGYHHRYRQAHRATRDLPNPWWRAERLERCSHRNSLVFSSSRAIALLPSLYLPARSESADLGTMARALAIIAILVAALSSCIYMLDRNLESFYIFQLDHLHDLAKRGIAAHGNDTRSIVNYITSELNEMYPNHVNLKQEWFFNNHGGAMGSMFIIHASQ